MGSLITSPVISSAKFRLTISASKIDNAVVELLGNVVKLDKPTMFEVQVKLVEGISTTWNVAINSNFMIVTVPQGCLPEGSKQSLTTLMELAEAIGCERCIVSFAKERKDKQVLMKTFLFLGFSPMQPKEWPEPTAPPNLFFMAYKVE